MTLDAAKPEIPFLVPLGVEQRVALRAILNNPVFVAAWQNAEMAKPSCFVDRLNDEGGERVGNNKLHQIQGWEMHKAALLRQLDEPRQPKKPVQENFPDSGTYEAEMASRMTAQRRQASGA